MRLWHGARPRSQVFDNTSLWVTKVWPWIFTTGARTELQATVNRSKHYLDLLLSSVYNEVLPCKHPEDRTSSIKITTQAVEGLKMWLITGKLWLITHNCQKKSTILNMSNTFFFFLCIAQTFILQRSTKKFRKKTCFYLILFVGTIWGSSSICSCSLLSKIIYIYLTTITHIYFLTIIISEYIFFVILLS